MLDRDLQTFIQKLNTPAVLKKIDDFLAGGNGASALSQQEGANEYFDSSSEESNVDKIALGKRIEKEHKAATSTASLSARRTSKRIS